MTVTKETVEQFYEFAHRQLEKHRDEMSWDELLISWQSACEREETNAAISEALSDIEAGRCQSVDEAMRDLRDEFGLAE